MNSVIIKDSLNPIMFILYLEARMMACEHMQQLHRASTGLESPGHCDSSIPRLERNRNDGSRALFVFHCKHQERCYVDVQSRIRIESSALLIFFFLLSPSLSLSLSTRFKSLREDLKLDIPITRIITKLEEIVRKIYFNSIK